MTLGSYAEKLFEKLNSFSAIQESCKKVYCSTCGGKARAFEIELSPALRQEIESSLAKTSMADLASFGEWLDVLLKVSPGAVRSVYLREAKAISPENIRAVDRFLLDARRFKDSGSEIGTVYRSLVEEGITLATSTEDSSLIETLVLVLGKDVLVRKELVSLALSKKAEPNIARVLYNSLREYLPEVRDYPPESGK